jgi:hypothetical protein
VISLRFAGALIHSDSLLERRTRNIVQLLSHRSGKFRFQNLRAFRCCGKSTKRADLLSRACCVVLSIAASDSGQSRSSVSEIGKSTEELASFLPKSVEGAIDVIEFLATSHYLYGKRQLHNSGCSYVTGRSPQEMGGICNPEIVPGSDGFLKAILQRGIRRAENACDFAEKFLIAPDAIQGAR